MKNNNKSNKINISSNFDDRDHDNEFDYLMQKKTAVNKNPLS
jgi:hypothetical protein